MAVDALSSELAFKAHVDAAKRDYICEPHLGASPADAAGRKRPSMTPDLLWLQSTALWLV